MKRNADDWDRSVGPSLEQIPNSKLPLKRSILHILSPKLAAAELVDLITTETMQIWRNAEIPTVVESKGRNKNVKRKVREVIEDWYKLGKRPENRLTQKYQSSLNQILDLAPKPRRRCSGGEMNDQEITHLREVMRDEGKQKTQVHARDLQSDWENDLKFYKEQRVSTS